MYGMNMKKALALLVSALLLCTLIPVGALFSANADTNNIVVNGDFEDGSNGWVMSSSASIVNEGYNSANALRLENPGAWSEAAIQVVAVEKNAEYTVTWYSKRVSGSGAFDLFIMNNDGYANLDRVGNNWMNETSGNWVKNECVVKTGNATAVLLKFSCEVAGAGVLLVDELTMVKKGGGDQPDPPQQNVALINGDFEDGTNGWNMSGSASVVSEGAYKGNGALKLDNPGAWSEAATQVVAVEPNTDYTFVWYSKRVSGSGAFDLFIMNNNGYANLDRVGPNWMNETSGNWVKNECVVSTGTCTEMLLKFSCESNNPGVLLVDELTITKVSGDEPDEPIPSGDNMLINGDFETGNIDPWVNLWGSNTVSMVAGRTGSHAVSVKSVQWGHVRQQVTVEANTDYVITGWHKNASNVCVLIKDGGDSANIKQETMTSGATWTKVTLEFNSGANTSVFVSIMGNEGGGSGVYDDFVMTKKGGDEPLPPAGDNLLGNGDFENDELTPWENLWSSNAVSVVTGRTGKAISVTYVQWGHVRQKVNVEANTDYVITGWHKNTSNVSLLIKDGGDSANIKQETMNSGATWTKVTLEFNSGSNTSVYVSLMGGEGSGAGTFDDFVMAKKGDEPDVPPPPVTGGAFQNGDFETGDLTGWIPTQGTTISAAAKRGGSYGAQLIGNGSYGGLLDQNFTVEAGKDYVLTFWYKANTSGANFVVKANGTGIASAWCNATEWTKVTLEFNAPTADLMLNICGGGTGVAEDLYVDDFVLVEKSSLPTELINGDFENGTNGWATSGAASISTDAHKGNGALQLDNPGAWSEAAMQEVAVEPGTNYVVTWYAKRVSGTGSFNMILMNTTRLANYTCDGQSWMNETSGDWVKYEVVFNTGSFNTVVVKLTAEANNAGVILVDDITLAIEGDEPVDPTANMIENGNFAEGKDGWKWGDETELVEGDDFDGNNAAKLSCSSAWGEALTQNIKVEKNTDYVIVFYTRRVSGSGVWNLTLMDAATINNGDKNIETTSGQRWFNHTNKSSWEETRLEFNSGDVEKVFFKFTPESASAGIFLLDYVGMWIKGNEPSPDDPDNPIVPPAAKMYMTSYGVLNNRPISDEDNLLTNGNFETSGGQWIDGFNGDTVSVVDDSTTLFGKKSLFFNTAGIEEETKLIFWVDVKPETSYVFSTWLKGAYLADDNRGLATIGVVDSNGKFLADWVENDIKRFLNGERQIVPTAWDNEWHLRGVEFNTGEATQVGIALAGTNSQMWIDDMALFEVGNGKKYMSDNAAGTVSLNYAINDYTCKDKDSLIPDPTFSKGEVNSFWTDSYGWRNNFLSLAENEYEYGTSLKYSSSPEPAPLSIIKTISVKPNTQYTFAVDLKILEDGWGKLLLCDGKKREPIAFLEISFDSFDYDPADAYYGWYTTVCKFNTDVYDTISLVIVDGGGEALLDNMRLYESSKGDASVKDAFIAPPADPDVGYDDYFDTEEPIIDDTIIEEEILPPDDSFIEDEEIKTPGKATKLVPIISVTDNSAWLWIGLGGGAVVLAGASAFLFFFLKKKKTPIPPEV